ncbi:hypothetical protein PYW08_015200 [Mythimna loreyi]|uniref:Uncharacterized protein n=1 Tax=Mythimna loreyi TaxID=667449 RepID=A0ACC2QV14_9NEOP|nr:hypothetical protein PYW08_015200 [Mythimna loreyi]
MPMSNAERQKRYRERLKAEKPEKYEEFRIKHLEKVKKNVKKIAEMTEEEKNVQRQKWKDANNRRSLKKNNFTPQINLDQRNNSTTQKKAKINLITVIKSENETLKKKNRTLKRQLYRYKAQIKYLKNKLTLANQRINSLTIKNPQLEQKLENEHPSEDSIINQAEVTDATPVTKTNQFLEELPSISQEEKEKVKKKIFLLNTLTDCLKESYNNADTHEKKTVLKSIALNETARKYKMKTKMSSTLGLKGRSRIFKNKNLGIKQHIKDIHAFFNRDDISRASAGKQEFKTKNKQKMQKRYLIDAMQKLHAKYMSEGGRASYASFTRHRPFYVVPPRLQDRSTCGCIKHSNISFKAIVLKKLGVIQTSDMDDFIKNITCAECYDCMYSKCTNCINLVNDHVNVNSSLNKDTPVQWLEWRLKNHQYTKITKGKAEVKTVKRYIKEIVTGTVTELIKKFIKDLITFKIHYFNKNYQYKAYRKYIENLDNDAVVIVCDFSENYTCKLSEEIQAVHFQTNQITLHTSVLYQKNKRPKPICSISPVNEHGPGAIWAHLDPIFRDIFTNSPHVKKIHIFSDGPTTQYRQKNNFYLFTKRLSDYGFEVGTWNYFEASHGKGAADGVGGAIKRKLDYYVAHGHDITSAEDAFTYLQDNIKVKLYMITVKDIQDMCEMIPQNVIPVKGTMKLHQIIYTLQDKQKICYRTLSCICEEKGSCRCEGDTAYHELLPSLNPIHRLNVTDESTNNINNDQENIQNTNITKKPTDSYEKVTILSSVKLTPENRVFLGSKMLPSTLKPIDTNFDIFNSHKINKIPKKSAQKFKKSSGLKKKTSKCAKTSTKSTYSSDSTSTETNFSVYDDSDLSLDLDSDNSCFDQDLERTQMITKAEVHNNPDTTICEYKENQIEENVNVESNIKLIQNQSKIQDQRLRIYEEKENYESTITNKNTTDKKRNKTENALKLETEVELAKTNYIENNKEKDLHTKDICKKNKRKLKPSEIGPMKSDDDGNFGMLDHDENKSENNYEVKDFDIDDTVLVRYFIKKTWKYFVGVVENINIESRMYSINFYRTDYSGKTPTFTVPKRPDKDVVPYLSLVKVTELLQIRDNPKVYVLMNDEDLVYF